MRKSVFIHTRELCVVADAVYRRVDGAEALVHDEAAVEHQAGLVDGGEHVLVRQRRGVAQQQGDARHRDLVASQRLGGLGVCNERPPLQVDGLQEAVDGQGQVAEVVAPIDLQLALAHQVLEV